MELNLSIPCPVFVRLPKGIPAVWNYDPHNEIRLDSKFVRCDFCASFATTHMRISPDYVIALGQRMRRRKKSTAVLCSSLISLIFGLHWLGLCLGQGILNTYPLQWSMVPTATFAKNLTANCICDVTAFACDPGCCCDPNCPAAVTATAQANGTCLPQGPPDQTLDYCVASNFVQKVSCIARCCGNPV